jgi:hypothetical protein
MRITERQLKRMIKEAINQTNMTDYSPLSSYESSVDQEYNFVINNELEPEKGTAGVINSLANLVTYFKTHGKEFTNIEIEVKLSGPEEAINKFEDSQPRY